MFIRSIIWILFILSGNTIFSQDAKINIHFNHWYGDQELNIETPPFFDKSDSVYIDVLKYYVSNISFYQKGSLVLKEKDSYHLIDCAHKSSLDIEIANFKKVKFDEIRFDLGIDSLTNVAGILGGDLEPTKGMYWTWQSGYINFKLEGRSNKCPTRNNEFVYHLGGYQNHLLNIQKLSFNVIDNEPISISLNIKDFLNHLDLAKQNHLMSPSSEAVKMAEKVAKSIYIQR